MNTAASIPAMELKLADFTRCAVWRFAVDDESGDEADESYVEPAPDGLRLGTHASFMVFATYRMTSGAEFPGAVQVDILDRKVIATPALLFARDKSLDPMADDVDARIARITKQSGARPSTWVLGATFAGEAAPRSARIATSRFGRGAKLLVELMLLRFSRRTRT